MVAAAQLCAPEVATAAKSILLVSNFCERVLRGGAAGERRCCCCLASRRASAHRPASLALQRRAAHCLIAEPAAPPWRLSSHAAPAVLCRAAQVGVEPDEVADLAAALQGRGISLEVLRVDAPGQLAGEERERVHVGGVREKGKKRKQPFHLCAMQECAAVLVIDVPSLPAPGVALIPLFPCRGRGVGGGQGAQRQRAHPDLPGGGFLRGKISALHLRPWLKTHDTESPGE